MKKEKLKVKWDFFFFPLKYIELINKKEHKEIKRWKIYKRSGLGW